MVWKTVCRSEELLEGEAREWVEGSEIIALFRHGNELFAVDGICMHQGGPLSRGKVSHCIVTCPWHGWQYELRSGANATTGKPMLKSYPIRENAGSIEIDLPEA
jgi:nitrite reductase (NADH) small subunit